MPILSTWKALLALCDLPSHESAFPQAFRSAWSDGSRDQCRAALSGKPGTEYLRYNTPLGASIRLHFMLDEAKRLADADESPVAQRHIAKAVAARFAGMLPSLGIHGPTLVAEVERMELAPQDERIQKGLALERAHFHQAHEESLRAIRDATIDHFSLGHTMQGRDRECCLLRVG